ncbi:hypothetical protein C1645_818551 [Glomus cerebriforme]|uniref:Uncharacterized protein n=1 Tax=Glomus cerebriforme TaxID=658196 RepID=A0A397TAW4_9GLOM|nr:hypothetical protein C1645_818551 [Glomus cerebriforme]
MDSGQTEDNRYHLWFFTICKSNLESKDEVLLLGNNWLRKVHANIDWKNEQLSINHKGHTVTIPVTFTKHPIEHYSESETDKMNYYITNFYVLNKKEMEWICDIIFGNLDYSIKAKHSQVDESGEIRDQNEQNNCRIFTLKISRNNRKPSCETNHETNHEKTHETNPETANETNHETAHETNPETDQEKIKE